MTESEPTEKRETTVKEMIDSLHDMRDALVELSLVLKDSLTYIQEDESKKSADLTQRIIEKFKNFSH